MIKIVIAVILCFACTKAKAQEIFIRTHTPDMHHHVSDSLRNDYTSRISHRDPQVGRTLNAMIVYNALDTFLLFSPQERAIAFFLVRDFSSLLNDVLKSNDFHQELYLKDTKKNYRHPRIPSEGNELEHLQELDREHSSVIASLQQSGLKSDEKDFLEMYLYSILAYSDLKKFDTEQMKSLAQIFLERYPSSGYVSYVNNVLYVDLKTSDFGFGAGVSTGFNILTGNVSSYFKSYLPIGINLELGYRNFLIKGEIASSFSKLPNKSFEYKNITWSNDSTPYILSGNLNIAYNVLNTPRYKITPFAGIGSHAISLSEKAEKILFGPGFQAGVDVDWQFAETNNHGDYYDAFRSLKNNTSWYLRARLGYAQFSNKDSRFNGSMIFAKVAIGFYSNPAVRVNREIPK